MPRTRTEDNGSRIEITHDLHEPLAGVIGELLTHMDGIEAFARRVEPSGLKAVLGRQQALALDLRLRNFYEVWAEAFHRA